MIKRISFISSSLIPFLPFLYLILLLQYSLINLNIKFSLAKKKSPNNSHQTLWIIIFGILSCKLWHEVHLLKLHIEWTT
jgi:hypothetical protein